MNVLEEILLGGFGNYLNRLILLLGPKIIKDMNRIFQKETQEKRMATKPYKSH